MYESLYSDLYGVNFYLRIKSMFRQYHSLQTSNQVRHGQNNLDVTMVG